MASHSMCEYLLDMKYETRGTTDMILWRIFM